MQLKYKAAALNKYVERVAVTVRAVRGWTAAWDERQLADKIETGDWFTALHSSRAAQTVLQSYSCYMISTQIVLLHIDISVSSQ